MFEKLKQLGELKKMHDSFKKEYLTVEKRGVVITMNGNFEVENIALNPELSITDQQNVLKEVLNEAREGIQKKLAQSLINSGLNI